MALKIAYHNMIINTATGVGTQATITVYDAGTLDLSTIYSDENGTAESNSFTTDANGRFVFYADQGRYDIRVSGVGITTYNIEDVPIVATYSVVSKPASGEYQITEMKVNAAGKIVIRYKDTAEA